MFKKEVYIDRRKRLKEKVNNGLIFIPGNGETPMNYPGNAYLFRQDSAFLYYFGLDMPDLVGIIDLDNDKEYIFGDDVNLDDIIWMGPQPSMKELSSEAGVENSMPVKELSGFLRKAKDKGQKIHTLPFYRAENIIRFADWLGIHHNQAGEYVSEELIHAVVEMRSIKDSHEIGELEKAAAIGYEMHVTAMKMCNPGVYEREISGVLEGIPRTYDGMISFPVILTQHGETLHNHYHGNKLEEGKMMLTDAGAETNMHYASDITRTIPVGGRFSDRQKSIYNIVLEANDRAREMTKPGVPYLDVHTEAARTIIKGLKDLGIMKGDVEEALNKGAHAMFMPHGLGHPMGLDVHDMEGLGENLVGYDNEIKRSSVFGFSGLRFGKRVQPGHVLTNEPGCYFIPELIDNWEGEKKFSEHIDYKKVREFQGFGGVRLEDDILVTNDGCRILGKRIPITVEEVEKTMNT
ncbi:MAG: aminopeptidase P family protein [Bacteroidales bacterium]|nr:aminopeptidase P family protein [Bacteroidales bacterium]